MAEGTFVNVTSINACLVSVFGGGRGYRIGCWGVSYVFGGRFWGARGRGWEFGVLEV